ncbi:MAG: phosphatidic acid phosphatase [Sphingomonas bacterium]|uniref:acid phosphatase n=1 Tax=Sphingomonas bacterium TaxID=1895847 RepID=UPI002612BB98|nr:phosphatase PAP2 family protein [Sphingomonas bacterium]MDB5708081.1 phosphatidic acid phosphatase [Sphingomonas bacterium]
MTKRAWILGGMLAVAVPALVYGQQPRAGYLPSGTIDVTHILPAAPQKGDARYEGDRAIFKATRHWLGTPRGDLATRDVNTGVPYMMSAYSCAVGVALTPQNAPTLVKVISKAGIDTQTQSGAAKDYFKRLRPFQIDKGKTCQAPEELKGSYDYPSGHATWAWTWASLLSELVPDRATMIMARGRAYGESRIVCGVHNATAVEAGRMTSASTLAAVHAQAAFQADLALARAEMTALRADPATPKPENCAAEAALVSQPIL